MKPNPSASDFNFDTKILRYLLGIVEEGSLWEVFEETMHPYTEGLFNSLPNIRDRKAMLKPIKGLMPDPSNLPEGCAFAPRCEYATEECTKAVPALEHVSGTHRVACSAYKRPGFMIDRRKNNG